YRDYYGMSKPEVAEAVKYYREFYKNNGLNAYVAYNAISQLLQELKAQSITLGVVTSKIEEYARIALKSTGLIDYFDFICARQPDEEETKTETLKRAIAMVPNIPMSSIIMIGDREHDVIAAKDNGVDSIGVLYGYGTEQEFVASGATYIAKDVTDLRRLLLP
ncbi:MAG: HAD hydrolase-like protein, partial [Candidatus Zixiibacteriota bacterium]